MKNFLILLYMGVIGGLAYLFPGRSTDTADGKNAVAPVVAEANAGKPKTLRASMTRAKHAKADEDVRDFIVAAAQARMMDFAEAKAATQKSATLELKAYAERMMADQSKMLKALRAMAADKGIELPEDVTADASKALADLRQKDGDAFDKKFVKMMITDHKRDVREFKNAIDMNDKDVKAFATHYLPMVEGHLQQIREIKKGR